MIDTNLHHKDEDMGARGLALTLMRGQPAVLTLPNNQWAKVWVMANDRGHYKVVIDAPAEIAITRGVEPERGVAFARSAKEANRKFRRARGRMGAEKGRA